MNIFKNREVRVRLARTTGEDLTGRTVNEIINPDSAKLLDEFGTKWLMNVAVAVVVVAAGIKAIDVIGNIIEDKMTN